MTQQTVKVSECIHSMSTMERSMRSLFWKAVGGIFIATTAVFGGYWKIQEEKMNKIAIQSIKADERLEKRLEVNEERQVNIERQQAAMGAKIDANMRWLMETCSRIETKQTRIQEKLERP